MEKEIQVSCQNLREETSFSTEILDKFKKSADNNFSKVLYNHLSLCLKYLKLLEKNGPEVFPNRFVYERFQVAKLVIDKISLLEFSVDPSLEELQEYKGMRSPPIETFNMTSDVKEFRKIKFCQNVDKGDILHLRVVEECETEYKLQVINKYNENERAVDYVVYAYMMKSYQLEKLPRPLQISDFVRAAVLGKLRIKENVFSKLLVTLNYNLVNEKYKDVSLGLVTASEIPFYPEDISNFNSYLDYMKAYRSLDDDDDDPQKIKCITSLGIDPYKIYSFHKHHDGGKFGKSEKINHWTMEKNESELSSKLVKMAENRIVQDSDYKSGLQLLELALEIYPKSDAAYAMRGQMYKQLFLSEKNSTYLKKSLDDFQKSLDMNGYNVIVVREYLTLLIFSTELFIKEEDEAKSVIRGVISKYKDIYDASRLLSDDNLEEEMR